MSGTQATRELLVINPNTSTAVTALLREHVQAELGAQVRVRAVTARFGAPYIIDEASYAVAGHATLAARHHRKPPVVRSLDEGGLRQPRRGSGQARRRHPQRVSGTAGVGAVSRCSAYPL